MKNKLPFEEIKLEKNEFIRKFSSDEDTEEYVWHRDLEDRIIKVISGSNWYLQIDNSIPEKMVSGKDYFIKKLTWHRVIKGEEELIIKLTKIIDNKQ